MNNMRTLGNTDMKVVPVGLGCMGFSHAYGAPTQKQEAVRMIRAAYEMGYNFFDTAECYIGTNEDGSTSYNEELVGEALADVRDKVVIATKFGVQHSPAGLQMDSRPGSTMQHPPLKRDWISEALCRSTRKKDSRPHRS